MNNRNRRHCHRKIHRRQLGATYDLALLLSGSSAMEAKAGITPDAKTQAAMIESIQDEYQAKAFYQAVIDKFGPVRPFVNIVQAEDRHAQRWAVLFQQYNLPIPEDSFAGKAAAPDSLKAACELAIDAEVDNIKMYDRFLEFIQEPDLRDTILQLRSVSENKHKAAFERCVNRGSRRHQGQGRMNRQGQQS